MEAGPAAGAARADTAATIASQQAEIERLQRRVAEERFAQDLRDALTLAATVGTIGAPVRHERLLEMILATAADIIGAHAASLFLVDAQRQDLVFEFALGDKAEEVKKSRIPLGQDVAGLVAMMEQPDGHLRKGRRTPLRPPTAPRTSSACPCLCKARSSVCWSCSTRRGPRPSAPPTWRRWVCSPTRPLPPSSNPGRSAAWARWWPS